MKIKYKIKKELRNYSTWRGGDKVKFIGPFNDEDSINSTNLEMSVGTIYTIRGTPELQQPTAKYAGEYLIMLDEVDDFKMSAGSFVKYGGEEGD